MKEEGAFMCLNWRDIKLSGADPAPELTALDIMVLPCNMRETLLADNAEEDRIPEDCNWNKTALIDYLGPIEMVIYKNEGRFVLDEYGEDKITKESKVTRIQMDEHRPQYIFTRLVTN